MNEPIGVFDSGSGGLTTLKECQKLLPNENFVYLSDSAYAPYGNRSNQFIRERVYACVDRLVGMGAKAIVVACNTATNVGIEELRTKYQIAFVGLEPAIKPAYEQLTDGYMVVLTTYATFKQRKFHKLLRRFDGSKVKVLPQKNLASCVETNLNNIEVLSIKLQEILYPYRDCESIVLGCTHYVYLRDLIAEILPNVKIYDGNEGAAARLKYLLNVNNIVIKSDKVGEVIYITTELQ